VRVVSPFPTTYLIDRENIRQQRPKIEAKASQDTNARKSGHCDSSSDAARFHLWVGGPTKRLLRVITKPQLRTESFASARFRYEFANSQALCRLIDPVLALGVSGT
jgi:hypothetical protein